MTTIDDFVGEYTIKTGGGAGPVIQPGQRLYVGTGTHGDPPPDAGAVGVSIYTSEETPPQQPVFPRDPSVDPAIFDFQEETSSLAFEGSWLDGSSGRRRPLYVQISLSRPPGRGYRAPYAMVLVGDPDQVGTWGADDQP
jgi:hypothetical protein